ncbi:cysteine/serine endopeptidase inhibitor [Streptomyces luteireticuli]|uniref:Ricin B lectin domain-containing protein n=1 Tax=Streptomyces luteireticuli TaxID=173858 RepID=A0ABP3IFJ2_9ACTN
MRISRRTGIAAGVLTAALAGVTLPAPSAFAASSGALTGLAGKCLDVPGGNTANGTRVGIWSCNGGGNQTWAIGDDGTIRALGKCLDANGAGTADGTRVQLWDCNGTPAQRWTYNAGTHDVVNLNANKCLDVAGWNSSDGATTHLWTCSGGANQKWNLSSGQDQGGQWQNGKMTYYNDKGYGACGTQIDAGSQDLVAVSSAWWTSANTNNDPLCSGVQVQVTYGGRTITVPVKDKCPTCEPGHIDLSESAFRKLVPPGTDMVPDVSWKFVR